MIQEWRQLLNQAAKIGLGLPQLKAKVEGLQPFGVSIALVAKNRAGDTVTAPMIPVMAPA